MLESKFDFALESTLQRPVAEQASCVGSVAAEVVVAARERVSPAHSVLATDSKAGNPRSELQLKSNPESLELLEPEVRVRFPACLRFALQ